MISTSKKIRRVAVKSFFISAENRGSKFKHEDLAVEKYCEAITLKKTHGKKRHSKTRG